MSWEVRQGDCVEEMAKMDDESIDSVVCDPPYGLEFMGKAWDKLAGTPGYNEKGRITERPDAQVPYGRGGGVNSYQAGLPMQEWHYTWAREALRVLKPGGHLLAFGGARTYHRLACAVEDAGFEIRDSLMYMYGSGFPKSQNVSKAIDKAERGVPQGGSDPTSVNHGRYKTQASEGKRGDGDRGQGFGAGPGQFMAEGGEADDRELVEKAQKWQGWGTALKPSHEPIVVARKPFKGTVAANVLHHGTGALNIDGCRIDGQPDLPGTTPPTANGDRQTHSRMVRSEFRVPDGRWPANIVLSHTPLCEQTGSAEVDSNGHHPGKRGPSGYGANDGSNAGGLHGHEGLDERHSRGEVVEVWDCAPGCPVAALDAQSGAAGANASVTGEEPSSKTPGGIFGKFAGRKGLKARGDSGGASRFFYCAKTGRSERDAGLEAFEKKPLHWSSGDESPGTFQAEGTEKEARNPHPTVKPINLMRWLVRLVTPPEGTVLDPFAGSGTTGCAAVLEGFDFIGCERADEYVPIARARLIFWAEHEGQEVEDVLGILGTSKRARQVHTDAGQMELA